ncbi:MAG: acetamidase, partial [Bacillota bacterium]
MAHTIHSRHVHYGWDNSLEPVLEVEPGETVEFEVVDASGGQLNSGSTAADVARLDFERVNPVTGPVFIKGARPGDVLEVEILEFGPARWGWTAIIPGFGLLADEFPKPYLKIWD